jgi:hypothetical protein
MACAQRSKGLIRVTDITSECQYIYHGPADSEGKVFTCTLTGHACLCVKDWRHCTRREFAMIVQAKYSARIETLRHLDDSLMALGAGDHRTQPLAKAI